MTVRAVPDFMRYSIAQMAPLVFEVLRALRDESPGSSADLRGELVEMFWTVGGADSVEALTLRGRLAAFRREQGITEWALRL